MVPPNAKKPETLKKLLVMKKIFTLNNEKTQEFILVTVIMAAIAVVSILF